ALTSQTPAATTESEPQRPATPPAPLPPGLDRDALIARFDGSEEILEQVTITFLDLCPTLLADVRAGVVTRDRDKIQRAAHSLRGSIGHFDAVDAVEAASRLELLAQDGDLANVDQAFSRVETAVRQFTA